MSGYVKQNFTKGQTLKADHLNSMDNGIELNDIAISKVASYIDSLDMPMVFLTGVLPTTKDAVTMGF